jgi:hypothetical protein
MFVCKRMFVKRSFDRTDVLKNKYLQKDEKIRNRELKNCPSLGRVVQKRNMDLKIRPAFYIL